MCLSNWSPGLRAGTFSRHPEKLKQLHSCADMKWIWRDNPYPILNKNLFFILLTENYQLQSGLVPEDVE